MGSVQCAGNAVMKLSSEPAAAAAWRLIAVALARKKPGQSTKIGAK